MTLLDERELELLRGARRAVLATLRADGRARLVPIAYALADADGLVLYSAIDDKPKSVADPLRLGRLRDIVAQPRVTVLVDHWSEDWAELAWLRLDGVAWVLSPDAEPDEHATAVRLLRARYAQYAGHALEQRPVLRVAVEATRSWRARS